MLLRTQGVEVWKEESRQEKSEGGERGGLGKGRGRRRSALPEPQGPGRGSLRDQIREKAQLME